MESRLDNIFRTTFRQAESTDTWMGIRREDPHDDSRRKKDDGENKKEKTQWQDDTIVSIAALKQFLATLIAPDSQYQKPAATITPDTTTPSLQQQRTHNAVHAYQTTARHIPPTTPPALPDTSADSPTLSQEENRIIHQLMNDLDLLLQNGVTSLVIQKEGSFLESLSRSAKTSLESVT